MDPRKDTETLKATEADEENDLDLEEDYDDDDEEDEAETRRPRDTERELDHGLKETFPASDPVSINPGAD